MFLDLTRKRRSLKKYSAQPVEAEKIDKIVETALRAPSGRAVRPCEFVVVDDSGLREKLSDAKPNGAKFIKEAPFCIVVCADPSKSDLWVEDCSIAAVTIQYAATSLGLASRWAHIKDKNFNDQQSSRDYIAGLLNLPDNLDIECIIAIGYPDEEAVPYKRDELGYARVSYNRYGQKSA